MDFNSLVFVQGWFLWVYMPWRSLRGLGKWFLWKPVHPAWVGRRGCLIIKVYGLHAFTLYSRMAGW